MEALFKNVDRRLESIDQRLDAIQAVSILFNPFPRLLMPSFFSKFNQTHSQALQTQMHTIQTLQTQQNTIAAAVTPLLPLLQSISANSHQCRTYDIADSKGPHMPTSTTARRSTPASSSTLTRKRSRSSSEDQISSSPSIALMMRKRSRIDPSSSPPPVSTKPKTLEVDGQGKVDVSSSTSLQLQLFSSLSPEIRKTVGQATSIQQTPRRPLREIALCSPKFSITPRSLHQGLGQQVHQVRPGGTPSSSKQYVCRRSHRSSSKLKATPEIKATPGWIA